ncbi:hypothetical protein I546_4487 [Mycobacterium kansasii 732]|nr:hypothetical protein I546_4487 [Mycobacterium kansasii 732]
MDIPFADAVRGRFGRRDAEFDFIEEFEHEAFDGEAAEAAPDTVDLPSAEPALLLQKMENRLIRQHLANPDVLSDEQLRKLRYILNFARLSDFEPGAAGPGAAVAVVTRRSAPKSRRGAPGSPTRCTDRCARRRIRSLP